MSISSSKCIVKKNEIHLQKHHNVFSRQAGSLVGPRVYGGKTHDYALLKKDLDPAENWFLKYRLWVDLGYQGIEKEFECGDLKNTF